MALTNGFVKLWRKSLQSDVWQNPTLWRFWTWCLMKATYKECEHLVGRAMVHLLPGQFVFGRRRAAQETGLSESAIRCAIKSLIKLGNLAIKSTNQYSIITIVKWESYQVHAPADAPADEPADRPADAPTGEPQRKKVEEVPKKREEEKSMDTGSLQQLCSYWKMVKGGDISPVWRIKLAEALRQGVTVAEAKTVFDRVRVDIKPWTLLTELLDQHDGGKGDGARASGQGGKRSSRRFDSADEQKGKFDDRYR